VKGINRAYYYILWIFTFEVLTKKTKEKEHTFDHFFKYMLDNVAESDLKKN
jgi:hypothetical protein